MKRRLLYLLVLFMTMVTGMRAQAPSLSTPLTIEVTTDGTIIVTDPKECMKYSLNDGVKNTMSGNTLADFCYNNMFNGCTGLTIAPALPATTLADYCYSDMFNGCSSLTTACELPAVTLKESCYDSMFSGCTSLTTAPALPATALVDYCYWAMFRGCTSLSSVVCLATDISATDCTVDWLDGVAAEGIFTAADKTVAWKADNTEGIPSGWTRENVVAVINDETNFPDEIFRTYLLNQDYGTDGC